MDPAWGASTRAVWGGEDGAAPHGATVPPVYHRVTFAYQDLDEWQDVGAGQRAGHIYSRNTNPTTVTFEAKMCALEGAAAATSFATVMAAISNALFALLAPGQRVVSIRRRAEPTASSSNICRSTASMSPSATPATRQRSNARWRVAAIYSTSRRRQTRR